MRTIVAGAIQPGGFPYDPRFDCLSPGFVPDTGAILSGHVLPRLDLTLSLLERCAASGCTVATTSEDATGLSSFLLAEGDLFDRLVVASERVAEERFAALANRRGMTVVACYMRRMDGANYNAATVFDRAGREIGCYRKTHLPPNELWHLTPGDALNVIETDFGTIGAAICYDIMFPEMIAGLAMQGAEIVFHPTGGYGWYDAIGEATLKTRANDNSVYIVTAKNYVYNGAGHSGVIDPWGQTLADAGFYENAIAFQAIDLDAPKTQPEWFYQTQMSGVADMRRRKRMERRPELYGALTGPEAERQAAPDESRREALRGAVREGRARWG